MQQLVASARMPHSLELSTLARPLTAGDKSHECAASPPKNAPPKRRAAYSPVGDGPRNEYRGITMELLISTKDMLRTTKKY